MRLLFVCFDNYADPSNGASIATREMLLALSDRGWDVHTFCSNHLDFENKENILQILTDRGMRQVETVRNAKGEKFSLIHFLDREIRSTLFLAENDAYPPTKSVAKVFLRTLQKTLTALRPDVVLTYGGHWVGQYMLDLIKMEGSLPVVMIHNCAYDKDSTIYCNSADLIIVPSEFSVKYYADKIGFSSVAIPSMFDRGTDSWSTDRAKRQFITYVNPDPNKGVFLFARIVKVMNERRPDIPFLAVEGRGGWNWISNAGDVLAKVRNLYGMKNTPYPKDFYERSKIVLVPSFFNETFGRVAAEAMMNGIPVVAGTRGSLPEVVGGAGITIDIPSQYMPNTKLVPTDEEAEPWVQALIRLWDDPEHYEEVSRRCAERGKNWAYDVVADKYDSVLKDLIERKRPSRKTY